MLGRSEEFIGQTVEVLWESFKKSQRRIFRKKFTKYYRGFPKENYKIGDFVNVRITSAQGTLKGEGLSEMN
jgi:tRNA-2-methylthio-N6-dimethylallyladenosine synthase